MKMMWSDDPVRDQLRYDAEQADADKDIRHCYGCGSAFWDGDTEYVLDGCEYCSDCIKKEIGRVVRYD